MVGIAVQAGSAGVLRALGIPLLEGRDLDSRDQAGARHVALVNRAAATALWPGESAIGRRLVGVFLPKTYGPIEVVGVYGDVRSAGPAAAPPAELMLPAAQAASWSVWVRNITVVMHTAGDPETLAGSARAAIRELDPRVAVERPVVLRDVVRDATSRERFLAALLAVFSVLALTIAAVGVYGVVSFTVARQSREFAIRHVLGAGRTTLLTGVFTSTGATAGTGAIAGVVLAVLLNPWLQGFLHEMTSRNGMVLVAVPATLVAIALLAALAPALRAIRVPLARTLRDAD
jgi:putative ABC transport system permease protein